MGKSQTKENSCGDSAELLLPTGQPQPEELPIGLLRTEIHGEQVEASADLSSDTGLDEWAVGTACYLCYGQCVNFGVHGKAGRPCAKGVAEIINRRRAARSGVQSRGIEGEQERDCSDFGKANTVIPMATPGMNNN